MRKFGDPSEILYLVDISSFIFRAFYAIRALHNSKGEPTNAVYGVASMLGSLVEEAQPTHLACVFDSKEPSFREELYPEYKANRSEPPEDLIPQFERIDRLIKTMGIPAFRQAGMEADDLIATLSKRWCDASPRHRVVIVTGDKDLMQLVTKRISVWDTMNDKVYGESEVEEKFGVGPELVRDFLGLVGDSSDNIPGVEGVGPKTAVELLKAHGDLEGVLRAADQGAVKGKRGDTLRASKDIARLSAQLATVRQDLDVKIDPESARYQFRLRPECAEFLREMDFHTLIKRWAKDEASLEHLAPAAETPGRPDSTGSRFRTVNTEEAFRSLLGALAKVPEFGFDLETTSLNPREAEIVGVAICHDPEFGCYVPIGHRGTDTPQLPHDRVMEGLRPFLEDPRHKKIGQNLKYDFSVLRCRGFQPDGIGADTMVAAYVLDPEGQHNLEALCARYLGYSVLTYEEVCGKGKDQIGFDLVPVDQATRYSGEDAWVTVRLWETLKSKLHAEGLMEVFARLDLPLVDVLSRMELHGVCIDESWLAELSREFGIELRAIEERIGAFTDGPVNLNSPRQLAHLLFDRLKLPPQGKTKTGYSTDASVLDAIAPLHEVPRLLLEYREIAKLKGTYVDPLPRMRDPRTGRIHASFRQTGTATGRLSSSEPNLQNIPVKTERGRRIRRAFVPSPGGLLVSADYSQIELRILAHMSGDSELIRSFRENEDVHSRTAGEIFGVAPSAVTERQRGIAKAINFGLMYGKTAFGLSQELKISRKEAQETIDRYFERYHAVKRFLDRQILDARERGWVATLAGRKRHLPDIRSKNPAIRANAERMAMNTPIQGTAADLMKAAMIELDAELRRGRFRSKLTIQVHDEVVLDCPKDEAEHVRALTSRVMEGAMRLEVPLVVNSAVGENWMDL